MPKKHANSFSEAKQDRSKRTLEDILEAAGHIVEAGEPDAFTSRELSRKSGYGLGTLNRRLSSIENVFLWAIKKGQKHHFENFSELVANFDVNLPVQNLVENMVDTCFSAMDGVNPKVIRFFENRLAKRDGFTPNFYGYIDVLVKPYMEASIKNQTNTFRHISEDEARLIFRAALAFAERPFVDSDPIAGSKEHRKITIDNLIRLLSK